ncbi:hypothetical protein D3C87_1723020 [compost metagenome]
MAPAIAGWVIGIPSGSGMVTISLTLATLMPKYPIALASLAVGLLSMNSTTSSSLVPASSRISPL